LCAFSASARVGEPEPFPIGVIGALTGAKAAYGLPHLNGARLAADEVNAAGGIAGRRIELLPADDRGEMGLVGELATRLIFDGRALALLGSVDSGCTHVAAMIAVKMQIPHLTSVATDPSLTRAGSPWTFRTLADDDRQAAAVVAWLRGRGIRRISLLAGASRYGRMGAGILARRFREAGGTVTGPVFLTSEPAAVARACDEAACATAEATVLWMLAPEGLAAVSELKRRGFSGPLIGGDGLATPAFYASGNPAVEGVVVTSPYRADAPTPGNEAFRRAYRARFGTEADSFAAHAYDTVRLLASAASSLGTALPEDLKERRARLRAALGGIDRFEGVTGPLGFDATGNDTRDVSLAVCRGARLDPIGEAAR